MLEYKSRWYGSKVVVAPRFLAPSKTGSECGHVLDLDVVAQGVESAAQLGRLRELDCGAAQGFHLAPPLESDAASALLGRIGGALPAPE